MEDISFEEYKRSIPPIECVMQAFQMEQWGKGIPILLQIAGGQEKMLDKQDGMLEKQDKMISKGKHHFSDLNEIFCDSTIPDAGRMSRHTILLLDYSSNMGVWGRNPSAIRIGYLRKEALI